MSIVKKTLGLITVLLIVSLITAGCASSYGAEKKYDDSFKGIWNDLMTKNKAAGDKAQKAIDSGDIDTVVAAYKELKDDHLQAKKRLLKLTAPSSLKTLHGLMIKDLDAGAAYADLLAKTMEETEGSYSDEQDAAIKKAQKNWLNAESSVKKELVKQGFQVK